MKYIDTTTEAFRKKEIKYLKGDPANSYHVVGNWVFLTSVVLGIILGVIVAAVYNTPFYVIFGVMLATVIIGYFSLKKLAYIPPLLYLLAIDDCVNKGMAKTLFIYILYKSFKNIYGFDFELTIPYIITLILIFAAFTVKRDFFIVKCYIAEMRNVDNVKALNNLYK